MKIEIKSWIDDKEASMKIEIKSWIDDSVLFEYESESNRIRWTVEAAVNTRANLVGASLTGANLDRANLVGASLTGANLDRARYGENIPLTRIPLHLLGLEWPILILDTHIKIGCELHPTEKWAAFSDEEIASMEPNALEFWKKYKDLILAAAKKHQEAI